MESAIDWHTAKALLEWQVELGATEAIGDAPVDRFAEAEAAAQVAAVAKEAPVATPQSAGARTDPVAEAEAAARGAADLDALRAALAAYPHCALKQGARSLVFADGRAGARVMIVGEAPGREEDLEGRPFVGRAGRLLDRMLAAIGLDRAAAAPEGSVYITNVLPWRPPRNREPTAEETAMMLPFLRRHIALAAPEVLVVMGNSSAQALLGRRGITRLRGQWDEALGLPALPMLHPAYLLRNPHARRMAWEDMLTLAARLEGA
ncbi:MAG: uracil-DNA glycosylase [Rhodosalinus sp.]